MSDSTTVSLSLWGLLEAQAADAIASVIASSYDYPKASAKRALGKGLIIDCPHQGEIDDRFEALLQSAKIGYLWDWAGSGEFSSGVLLRDPIDAVRHEFYTRDDRISLTLDEIDRPDRLNAARRAHEVLGLTRKLPLVTYDTAHEFLEALSMHPELAEYGKLHRKTDLDR